MKLFELAAADGRRFSPHCWKSRMALAHLGIEADSEPVGFMAIRRISAGQFDKVPVLEHEGKFIEDSWQIAAYLNRLSNAGLFQNSSGQAFARFTENWVISLFNSIGRLVVPDIAKIVHEEDHPYFEESRGRWLGVSFDQLLLQREADLSDLRSRLAPARRCLQATPYLCGDQPGYPDFQLFGAFQWARVSSPVPLVDSQDPLYAWFERCLDLYDGLGRREPGYDWNG